MSRFLFLLVIIFIIIVKFKIPENFINCPETYQDKLISIKKVYVDQLRAYTPNDYIYITENVVDLPIPVNSNFLNNKY